MQAGRGSVDLDRSLFYLSHTITDRLSEASFREQLVHPDKLAWRIWRRVLHHIPARNREASGIVEEILDFACGATADNILQGNRDTLDVLRHFIFLKLLRPILAGLRPCVG